MKNQLLLKAIVLTSLVGTISQAVIINKQVYGGKRVAMIHNISDDVANFTLLNAVNDSPCMTDKSINANSHLEIVDSDLLKTENCKSDSLKLKVWGKIREINDTSLAFNKGGYCTVITGGILGEKFKAECHSG